MGTVSGQPSSDDDSSYILILLMPPAALGGTSATADGLRYVSANMFVRCSWGSYLARISRDNRQCSLPDTYIVLDQVLDAPAVPRG